MVECEYDEHIQSMDINHAGNSRFRGNIPLGSNSRRELWPSEVSVDHSDTGLDGPSV